MLSSETMGGGDSGSYGCLTTRESFISANQTRERVSQAVWQNFCFFNSFTAPSHLMVFAWSHFKADSAIHSAAHIFPQTKHLYWEHTPIPQCHLDWTVFQAENHKNAYPWMIWGARLVSRFFNIQKAIQGIFLLFFLLLSQNIQVMHCYCNQLSYRKTFKRRSFWRIMRKDLIVQYLHSQSVEVVHHLILN